MSTTLILGGARSGKSEFAEELASGYTEKVAYIATAIPFDDGMRSRIKKHRIRRPENWSTIEKYKDFSDLKDNIDFIKAECILLDCLTVLSTNWMLESGLDFDNIDYDKFDKLDENLKNSLKELIDICEEHDKKLILVTNEIGLGVIPAYKMGSIFRDLAGALNKFVATNADNVYYVLAGIPVKIKDKGVNIKCSKDF